MSKDDDWCLEPTDEDFEREARYSWLTGISKGPADEFEVNELVPERHGISGTAISNCNAVVSLSDRAAEGETSNHAQDPDWGMPMSVKGIVFQLKTRRY